MPCLVTMVLQKKPTAMYRKRRDPYTVRYNNVQETDFGGGGTFANYRPYEVGIPHFGSSTEMPPFSDALCHFTAIRTIILLSLLYYLSSKYHDAQKGDEYQTIPTICKGSYEGGSGMCSR